MFLIPRFKGVAKPELTKSSIAGSPKAESKQAADEDGALPLPVLKKRRKQEEPTSNITSGKPMEGDVEEPLVAKKKKKIKATKESKGKDEVGKEPLVPKKKKTKATKESKGKEEVGKEPDAGDGVVSQPKKKKEKPKRESDKKKVTVKGKPKKEKVAIKTRANQHATRRAKKRKQKEQAVKQVEKLREAKLYERQLPDISARYLQAWAAKKDGVEESEASEWHFSRATQRWLLQNAYESDKVSKETFAFLLRYLEGLRGSGREQLEADAHAMVERDGAPAPVVAEEQPMGKKRRKQKEAEAAAARERGEEPAAPEPDEEELTLRKMRLKRASKLLAALEASAHLVEAEAAAKAAAKAADS